VETFTLKYWNWSFDGEIRSKVEELVIRAPNQTVVKCIENGSFPEYANATTDVFLITRQTVHYWPGGLEKNFPCIKTFEISDSGLKVVSKYDLQPHKKMRKLFLHNNDLQSIDGDLFEFNPEITYVDFSLNKLLTVVGENVLHPLKNLKAAHFHKCRCIDYNALDVETVKRKLSENCGSFEVMRKQLKSLRKLMKLYDVNLEKSTDYMFEVTRKLKIENDDQKVFVVCRAKDKDCCNVDGAQALEVKFPNSSIYKVKERTFMNSSDLWFDTMKEANNFTSIRIDNQLAIFLPLNLSANFPFLTAIAVTHSSLHEIDANAFDNMLNVKNLTLSNNRIEVLPVGAFKSLKNLNYLDLSYNDVEYLLDNTFQGLWKLEELKIHENEITKIHDKAFNYLRNVNKLSLQSNHIETLSATFIDAFANIEFVDFSENTCIFGRYPGDSLKAIKKQIKSTCHALIEINCNFKVDNDELELSENYTCTVQDLNLENHVSNITNVIGDHLPEYGNDNVTILAIINQTLKSIPKNIADFFPNIEEFTIERSKLQWLKRKDFKGLESLRKLVIRHNNIVMRYDTFQPIPQLEHLDLSYNKIKFLRTDVFSALTQLKVLDVSHNRLYRLNSNVLPATNYIEEAYFNNNVIQFIEEEVIDRLENANVIDFTRNFAFDMKFMRNEDNNDTFDGLYRETIVELNARWFNSTVEMSQVDFVEYLPDD
jgi:Leucine-rich repeat (LRR) protein